MFQVFISCKIRIRTHSSFHHVSSNNIIPWLDDNYFSYFPDLYLNNGKIHPLHFTLWPIYIYIYIYTYQMDCVCQRCHKECSTSTCADDYYCCWKSPNSNHLCDHGFMDVLKHQLSGSRKIDFMHKQVITALTAWRQPFCKMTFCLVLINKLFKKQSGCQWFKMPWCLCDHSIMASSIITAIWKPV